MSSVMTSRATPSYGIKYISAFKNIKPVPIKPIIAINKGLQDFDLLKYLSRGDSGTVYLARDTKTTKEYALKVMPKTGIKTGNALNEQRLQCLVATNGPSFLLPILASWHDNRNYYIVTEYMGGRDMAVEIARCGSFDEDRVRFYGAQMIMAVEELKTHRIIHRDIKPTNILIDDTGHLRLTDFGFAKKFEVPAGLEDLDNPNTCFSFDADANCESGSFFTDVPNPVFKTNEVVGTPQYMSPQRIAGKDYGDQEDLWSVGVVVFLMFTGRMPFDDNDPAGIAYCVTHKPLEFKKNDFLSDNAKSLLIGMLTKDVRARLSLEQVKEHAFFKGIDWSLVKKHGYQAEWTPFLAPHPKKAMSNIPNFAGGSYEAWSDPLPSYSYTSPKMDEPKPKVTVEKVKRRSLTFRDFGSVMTKMLRSNKKEETSSVKGQQQEIQSFVAEQAPASQKKIEEKIDATNAMVQEAKAPVKAEVCFVKVPYEPMPKPQAMTDAEILQFKSSARLPPLPARLAAQIPGYQPEEPQAPPPLYGYDRPASMLIHESPVKGQTPAIFLQPSPSSGFVGNCALTLADVPDACSVEVEIWEETVPLKPAKSHMTTIGEEDEEEEDESDEESLLGVDLDDFPLPPGYTSFEDRKVAPSPCTTPVLSPTPTVYAPSTPAQSPTPTVVEFLSPVASRSTSPSSLKHQAHVDDVKKSEVLKKLEERAVKDLTGYKFEQRHIQTRRLLRDRRRQNLDQARREEEERAFKEAEMQEREAEEAKKKEVDELTRKLQADEEAKKREEEAAELKRKEEDEEETRRIEKEMAEEAKLKRVQRRNNRRFSWEDREVFSPIASRPPATPPKLPAGVEDRYTTIPVRRHRAAIRARALAMQAPIYDGLGPLPAPRFQTLSEPEESPILKSIMEMPIPTTVEEEEEVKEEREEREEKEEGKRKRRSVVGVLIDSIKDYLEKMFSSPSSGRQEAGVEPLKV